MMEVTLELSDPVVMQSKCTMFRLFHKNFGNWSSSCQNFIKYNSNNLEEIDEEKKEPINIELTEENQILIMMKILLTLDDQM